MVCKFSEINRWFPIGTLLTELSRHDIRHNFSFPQKPGYQDEFLEVFTSYIAKKQWFFENEGSISIRLSWMSEKTENTWL